MRHLSAQFYFIFFLGFASQALGVGLLVGKTPGAFHRSSVQVVYVKEGDRNTLTFYSDFRGENGSFVILLPFPFAVPEESIALLEHAPMEQLEAFSAPILFEQMDPDPCLEENLAPKAAGGPVKAHLLGSSPQRRTRGSYKAVALSAPQSQKIQDWLQEEGYQPAPESVPWLKEQARKNHFIAIKVELKEHSRLAYQYLRPIQVTFTGAEFSLPLELGPAPQGEDQDLYLYVITDQGQVAPANYAITQLPSNKDIPAYIKYRFEDFYREVFLQASRKNKGAFLEYAGSALRCENCNEDTLTLESLSALGVQWLSGLKDKKAIAAAKEAYLSRYHLRGRKESLPQKITFQAVADLPPFQEVFLVRHAWMGSSRSCAQANAYANTLSARRESEARTLASLTGWSIERILNNMTPAQKDQKKHWYERLFDEEKK